MLNRERKFSKSKWLESANSNIERKVLSQREVDDALIVWVNDLDGTPESELKLRGIEVNSLWLV